VKRLAPLKEVKPAIVRGHQERRSFEIFDGSLAKDKRSGFLISYCDEKEIGHFYSNNFAIAFELEFPCCK